MVVLCRLTDRYEAIICVYAGRYDGFDVSVLTGRFDGVKFF